MKKLFTWIFVGVALSGVTKLLAQTESEVPAWDQQFFFGNKVSWGSENWKYSGELQIRLKDYGKALDNWYLEGVAAYVFNKQHALNLIYFVGAANLGDSWSYQGNFLVQLVINIVKDYKYLPAKYISF